MEEHDARKVYAITTEGKRDLGEHTEDVQDFYENAGEGSWEDFADELRDLTRRIGRMFKSIGRSARRGRLTPTTMKRLLDRRPQAVTCARRGRCGLSCDSSARPKSSSLRSGRITPWSKSVDACAARWSLASYSAAHHAWRPSHPWETAPETSTMTRSCTGRALP